MSVAMVDGAAGTVTVPWPTDLATSEHHRKKHRHQDVIDFTVGMINLWLTPAAPLTPGHPSYAEFSNDPKTELPTYITQVLDVSQCPSECLPVALVYLRRILQRPRCSITCNNVHRLFAVAIMLASKWLEDQTLCTRDWGVVTALTEKTLVKAEREFLQLLQWNIYCDRDEYLQFVASGRKQLASPTLTAPATSTAMQVPTEPLAQAARSV